MPLELARSTVFPSQLFGSCNDKSLWRVAVERQRRHDAHLLSVQQVRMERLPVCGQRVNRIQHETLVLPWFVPRADAFGLLPGEFRPTGDATIPHLQPPALQFAVRADTLHHTEDRTVLSR